jgi:DNA-directed RNA polymerase subunit alpha
MIGFKKIEFNIKTNDITNQNAIITVDNLEKGYGITLGNALRRTMMLSIPGTSVFAVKISGVTHEFQAFPGAVEDVINVIQNIKNLVVEIDHEVYNDEELNNIPIEN